jgi:hypothetical protein
MAKSEKTKPLGLHKERELAKHCRKKLAALPKLPVPVADMTPREYAIFEIAAALSGLATFVADYVDPTTRESRQLDAKLG